MRNLYVKTQPAAEPVTADEFKLHSRIDVSDDDTLLSLMIAAARQASELYTGRAYITQTLVLTAQCDEDGEIALPRPPFTSVTGVKVLQEDTTWKALALTTEYKVMTMGDRGVVVLVSPDVQALYEVTYAAGYGAAASSVPSAIRQAILRRAATMYEYREDEGTGTVAYRIDGNTIALEAPYKVLALGAGL